MGLIAPLGKPRFYSIRERKDGAIIFRWGMITFLLLAERLVAGLLLIGYV